ncbi:uncharacterized protein V6R79_022346 [Siganus canaliculatus]
MVLCDAHGNKLVESSGTSDPMRNPIVDPCCRSLIGCRECIDEWAAHEPSCPRCRDPDFATNRFEIIGMEDTVKILKDSIRD